MFERKSEKVISRKAFLSRQLRYSLYAGGILMGSLLLGIIGYMATTGMTVVDALLNASMILTGMGPVSVMETNTAKVFASFYAIYSGVAFLSVIGVFIAPIVHRFLHKHHLED